jgi:hypothetical protein
VGFQAVSRPGLQPIERPPALGNTDNRNVQRAAFHHRLQGWKDLLVGEIAGGPEEDQRIAIQLAHGVSSCASNESEAGKSVERGARVDWA